MNHPEDNQESVQEKSPQHIAIIMDGNGRWAKKRGLPRVAGHHQGVRALRRIVQHCVNNDIPALTVYAFSSENWQRPAEEVKLLMELFIISLNREIKMMHKNNIRVRFIGERMAFPEKLIASINHAESVTAANTGLNFNIAANYGGRWDISQACKKLIETNSSISQLSVKELEAELTEHICLNSLPAPDLFIRTGGEQRISNYLLWQLAYTELYFTDCLWPDFKPEELGKAIEWFLGRERRFGKISEQVV